MLRTKKRHIIPDEADSSYSGRFLNHKLKCERACVCLSFDAPIEVLWGELGQVHCHSVSPYLLPMSSLSSKPMSSFGPVAKSLSGCRTCRARSPHTIRSRGLPNSRHGRCHSRPGC
jgi:hypothetical protein